MKTRTLSPFFISFGVLLVSTSTPSDAAQGGALQGFLSPLSAYRHSTVDAQGMPVSRTQAPVLAPTASAVVPAESPAPAATAVAVTYRLDRENALTQLSKALVDHYGAEGELQLDLLRSWVEPAAAASPLTLTVAEYPAQLSSSMPLRLRVLCEGEVVAEMVATIRAQLWRDAWATRQPVSRDEAFDASALELKRVDVLRERDALLAGSGDSNQSFTRSLPAGRILGWRDIAPRALVRKGELVEVAAVDGPISVSMKAVALQNGAAGETISVRNPESKRDITAQVVGEKRVVVRF